MVFLRRICPGDRERMLDILANDTIKQTYMLPDYENREAAVPLFLRLMEMSEDDRKYVRAVSLDSDLIGFINYTDMQTENIELGYAVHPDFQGKGYMTAALKLAMEELFSQGYRQIVTGAFSTNTASIRVMEKCSMVRTEQVDEITYRGNTHKCVYYRKTQE